MMGEVAKRLKQRHAKGEKIGAGYFVFRRHKRSGRIAPNPRGVPFEHETAEAAMLEAGRLADQFPGETFEVFRSVGVAWTEPRENAA